MEEMYLVPHKMRMLLATEFKTKDGAVWRPRADGLGVTPMTLINWRNSTTPEIKSLELLCKEANKTLNLPHQFKIEMFYDDVRVKKFAELIGFNEDVIKKKHYMNKFITNGPHTEYVFDTKRKNEKQMLNDKFKEAEGFYHVFRAYGQDIVRLGIAVCAAVPITDRNDEGRFAIVADLSIPNMAGMKPFFYTGTLCQRHDLIMWQFLQDSHTWRDFAVFMTDQGDPSRSDRQRLGSMMTRAQKGSTAIPVTYDIVMRRVESPEVVTLDDIGEFLTLAASRKPNSVDRELKEILLKSDKPRGFSKPRVIRRSAENGSPPRLLSGPR